MTWDGSDPAGTPNIGVPSYQCYLRTGDRRGVPRGHSEYRPRSIERYRRRSAKSGANWPLPCGYVHRLEANLARRIPDEYLTVANVCPHD
jgi:hypothetical protein